jgi:hypothetical protein
VDGEVNAALVTRADREGWQALQLGEYPRIRFDVMLGVILKHTEDDSNKPVYSYFDPSENSNLFRNHVFFLSSARSMKNFQHELKNFDFKKVVAENFASQSKDSIHSIVTLRIRYFY